MTKLSPNHADVVHYVLWFFLFIYLSIIICIWSVSFLLRYYFIQQRSIKLIKSDSKDNYIVTKQYNI